MKYFIFLLNRKYYKNPINLIMVCDGRKIPCREVFLLAKELCLQIFVGYNNEKEVRMAFCLGNPNWGVR